MVRITHWTAYRSGLGLTIKGLESGAPRTIAGVTQIAATPRGIEATTSDGVVYLLSPTTLPADAPAQVAA
jgi:hypothetical protein